VQPVGVRHHREELEGELAEELRAVRQELPAGTGRFRGEQRRQREALAREARDLVDLMGSELPYPTGHAYEPAPQHYLGGNRSQRFEIMREVRGDWDN
jgi:hypothetical protein